MSMPQTTTDYVRAARARNANATAASIARELGISRERVRQILLVLGLPTRVAYSTHRPSRNSLRYAIAIPPHTVGSVCELEVCADLLKRGMHIYRSVSPHAPCDVIALAGTTLIRIEVRAAKKGRCVTHGDHDCLAAVNPDGRIIYTPALDTLTKST